MADIVIATNHIENMVILHILVLCTMIYGANTNRMSMSINGTTKTNSDQDGTQKLRVKRAPGDPIDIPLYFEENGPMYGIIVTGTDFAYTVTDYEIGPQRFKMAFDTGSFPTWITGIEGKSNYYKGLKKLLLNDTINFQARDFSVQYPDRSWAAGSYYYDYFCLDESHCANQSIGISFVQVLHSKRKIDGVFGLANFKDPTPLRNKSLGYNNYNTDYSIIENMMDIYELPEIMSIWLHAEGGMLTIGRPNDQFYRGEISWIKVQRNDMKYWQLEGNHVFAEKRIFPFETVILNSGIVEILAPMTVVESLFNWIGANKEGNFNCEKFQTLPNLDFVFDEHTVTMEPADYVAIKKQKYLRDCCRLRIQHSHTANTWHLGAIFLRKRYTVFNFAEFKVGFAVPNPPRQQQK